jgi:beta-glucosidase
MSSLPSAAPTVAPRVTDLLGQLDVRAKIGQLNQRLKGWEALHVVNGKFVLTDVLKREVERCHGLGALYGLQRADPWSGVQWNNGILPERSLEAVALVQDYVTAHSASAVPVLFVEEAPHGLQSLGGRVLPVNLAQAAAWDDDLVAEIAEQVAAEIRARGVHVALLSGLDMLRDPRWGRGEECFSEDPMLSARLVRATVSAMQGAPPGGRIDDSHVAVVVKHLAAQGAGIGGRNGSGAPLGWRELHEIHLPAAHAAAEAGVAGYMAAYNDIDGVPCCANRSLLTGVLRDTWNWEGIVMADGTAIDRLLDSSPDAATAAALALRAGVDISLWDETFVVLDEALDRGLIEMADIDRACGRVLGVKERVGLLDGVAHDIHLNNAIHLEGDTHLDSHAPVDVDQLVRRLARESVVLLRNDAGLLPLGPDLRIAVVGPNADSLEAQLGDYTAPRPADDPTSSTVASALRERFGTSAVTFAQGSRLRERIPGGLDDVRAASRDADVAIVVVGGSSRRRYESDFDDNGAAGTADLGMTNGEGVDLSRVAIDEVQLEVARAAGEAGRPVIGIVIGGRPHVVTELAELCQAVIFSAFPGTTGGDALVDVLTGVESPSGRLPVSLPGAEGVWPVAHNERRETSRGYVDATRTDTVPMGTGLSYVGVESCFRDDDRSLSITAQELAAGRSLEVSVRVRHVGGARGRVVVPLWGRQHVLGVRPRVRQVIDYASVEVGPGETRDVTFQLGLDQLGSWTQQARVEALPSSVELWLSPDLNPPAGNATRVATVTSEQAPTAEPAPRTAEPTTR